MQIWKTSLLFAFTAFFEIGGCYLINNWLRKGWSIVTLIPASASLFIFAWLLTFHPTEASRVYAAYGGVYVAMAILWLFSIDGVRPDRWDILGSLVCLAGASIIMFGPRV